MPASAFRISLLVLGCGFLFALITGVLTAILPPRKPSDWMAIGTVSTLLTMLGLYMTLVLTGPGGARAVMPQRRVRVNRGENPPAPQA